MSDVPASAVVLGPFEHFDRLLVSQLLQASGTELLSVAQAGERARGDVVTVLVEPELCHWDAARGIGAPIVLLTSSVLEDDEVVDMVVQGADAVLNTDDGVVELLAAIETALDGGITLSPTQARAVAAAVRAQRQNNFQPPLRLTPREIEILRSVDKGESVKQTARTLDISVKTVESLQRRLFRKLDVHSRGEALARARMLNLLAVSDIARAGHDLQGTLTSPRQGKPSLLAVTSRGDAE